MTDALADRPDSADSADSADTARSAGGSGSSGAGDSPDASMRRMTTAERTWRVARQFLKFGIVGASGVVVNNAVVVIANKTTRWLWDFDGHAVFTNLLGTQFHIRWYHVFSVLAFVVANLWNFNLNRRWTFKTVGKSSWFKELVPFMMVGIGGLIVTLAVQTALINPGSPIALSREIWNGSSGLRDPIYWGNLIGVCVAIPVNFLLNKLWTFRAARDHHVPVKVTPLPEGNAE